MEYVSGLTWKQETKIVIGIDIGTTQSAVSVGLLEQGVDVKKALHSVTEWPGQWTKQSKIPTAIWYDSSRKPMSFGAEAMSYETEDKADDLKWVLAKEFKLLLHPDELRAGLKTETLPYGVTLEQVYTDFLKYLFQHTEKFFKDIIAHGDRLWPRYRSTMEFFIAHPNAWSTREQAFLRKVATQAGLVNAINASKNVRFVTEAEASIHYCLYDSNLMHHLKIGTNFAVCDAGGSTVDTTLYSVAATSPIFKVEEKRAPGCVQAGAIYVDREAKAYMEAAFRRAGRSDDDVSMYSKNGIRDFEAHAKRAFRDEVDGQIYIGNSTLTLSPAGVRRGRMTIAKPSMKSFFDVCVKKILSNVDELLKGVRVSYVLLVGGFGDSACLRDEFRRQYAKDGCEVILVDSSRPTSKAVADGAIIWSYSQVVISRRPRASYGSTCATLRDLSNPHHVGRPFLVGLDGSERVLGLWETLVHKDVPLQITSVNRSTFTRQYSTSAPSLGNFEDTFEAYAGDNPPYWSKSPGGLYNPGFRSECKVTANLQSLPGALEMKFGAGGNPYWELVFSLCIRFGGVELEAYLEWEEKGVTRQGAVTIVPDRPI
ncbi:unnamed protein product [Rhizoctonia solani]|uniref:Uncharacterized protein n=1 Tax=Rhizoctonia solani TaxID=456999 RepID=A0A8H3BQV6_9AGAM|nr:unnamed protein product [Rhizoctonia solani]